MPENNQPSAEAQMMIRKPVSEVFEAFMDPAITKQFWFTKGSGRLELNKKITWEWEMYKVSTTVIPKEIIQDKKISIEWGDPVTYVDFNFRPLSDGSTFVTIRNYGFRETGEELLKVIKDSTGGFTTVVDGLKAFLEHNIRLNLVADKFPNEITIHGK